MADELYINCARNISSEGLIKLAIRDSDCAEYLTCDNKNESLESLLKRAFSIDDEGNVALNVCGCGGGGGLTSITYEELVALQLAAGFTPGAFYLLTDFATVHYFTDGSTTLTDINTGTTEQLILFATAPSVLDSRVYSPSYPQDVLHYDWNPANWLTDISFSSDGVNIVDGWKGVITYRWDTKQDNSTGYDFRNVKFRRWALAPAGWDNLTSYNLGDYVLYAVDGNVYKSMIADNIDNTPGGAEWILLVDMSATVYWSWTSGQMNNIPCDEADYEDFYTWSDYSTCNTNHIGIACIRLGIASRLNNIVFGSYCTAMTYGSNCNMMTYGSGCYLMTYGSGCNTMTYGSGCGGMTYGNSCYSMTYGSECNTMTYGSSCNTMTYGSSCSAMTYGSSCTAMTYGSSCNTMTYGSYCYAMTYGSYCYAMTYGSYCGILTFDDNATMCDFKDSVASTDFTAEPLMTAAYNKTIQVCTDASIVISYIDCTGAPTYTVRAVTTP